MAGGAEKPGAVAGGAEEPGIEGRRKIVSEARLRAFVISVISIFYEHIFSSEFGLLSSV